MKKERIVIDSKGVAVSEVITTTPIPNLASHFRKLSLSSALRLPALTPDTWMTYNGNHFTAFRRILRLQLHCVWKPEEVSGPKGEIFSVIRPSFNETPERTGICERDFYWKVPKDMILLFICSKLQGNDRILANNKTFDPTVPVPIEDARSGTCGLIAVDKANGKLYRLPLPNTGDDGALCTGALHANTAGAWTQFRGIFASWSENQWNRDLISATRGNYKKLFLLEASTLERLALKNSWQSLCFPISPSWVDPASLSAGLEGITD